MHLRCDAIERHEARLAYEAEMNDARRDLAQAEDESWSRRVSRASMERQAADGRVVAREAETDAEAGASVFQKMLDEEAWRRGAKKR